MTHWLFAFAALIAAPAAASKEPVKAPSQTRGENPIPAIGPAPAWVVAPTLPASDPAKATAPLQFLLSSSQEKMLTNGVEQYVQYAAIPQTTAGLQALGTITLPWNTERTDLTLHKVVLHRGGKVVDLLKPSDVTVLRRESNLERAMLDGIRTVVIPARGLQVGDILEVALSYKTKPSTIALKPEEIQLVVAPLPQLYAERRFLVPDDVPIRWKTSPSIAPAQITKGEGMSDYRFVQRNVEPMKAPANAPPRFKAPIIQVSGYAEWSEISDQLRPLFEQARRPSVQSPLTAEAARIAAWTPDEAQRMLAALRLVQDQVRYVALLLGEGAYVPASADETWERKFGDCKGKTALLLALLDQFGIEAEPLLVSDGYNDRLGEMLPSLAAFDHVLVRAKVEGRSYYLDPTGYGQRALEEVAATPFRHGLPLRLNASLEELPDPELTAPTRESKLVWDGSKGFGGEIPFEATLVLRGPAAAEMRAKLASTADAEEFETDLKQLVPTIHNDDLEITAKEPEAADGSFVVRFTGDAKMDWSPFEGERDTRFAFAHSTLRWEVDFDRKDGAGKDWPVQIGNTRYWERTTESVILPDGGKGYSIDAAPLQESFAGSSASRSVRRDGDRVTMVADFQHLKREISAADARAAEPVLKKIDQSYAYIVGPPEQKIRRQRAK